MPSRRTLLRGLGTAGVGALAGCNAFARGDATTTPPKSSTKNGSSSSNGTTSPAANAPATSSSNTSSSTSATPPPSSKDARFEASLVRHATADHPARIAAKLTNVGDRSFTVMDGYGLPFTASSVSQVHGDGSIFLYPASKPASTYVGYGDSPNGTKGTTTQSSGCWRLRGAASTAAIALVQTLHPGDSARVAYDVFVFGDGPCPSNGRYHAAHSIGASGGAKNTQGPSTRWHLGLTISYEGGDVSKVTATGVGAGSNGH